MYSETRLISINSMLISFFGRPLIAEDRNFHFNSPDEPGSSLQLQYCAAYGAVDIDENLCYPMLRWFLYASSAFHIDSDYNHLKNTACNAHFFMYVQHNSCNVIYFIHTLVLIVCIWAIHGVWLIPGFGFSYSRGSAILDSERGLLAQTFFCIQIRHIILHGRCCLHA